jgi:hypothetical protein
MRTRQLKIRLVAAAMVASAVAILVTTATAAGSFSGKVCSMVSAKQVLAVHVPTNCTQQKTVTSSEGTVQTGIWGKNSLAGPRLSVGIWKVANANFLTVLKSSHASGKPVGIGNWSREDGLANGKTADSVSFLKGSYFVLIALTTAPNRPLKNAKPLIALAKTVASKL